MLQKIVGSLIIGLSVFGLFALLQGGALNSKKTAKTKIVFGNKKAEFVAPFDLNIRWRKDFEELVKDGEIPKAWGSVREVRFIPLDKPLVKLVDKLIPPIIVKADGGYILEVTLMAHIGDDGNTYVIFQHNLLDVEHENTVWELNRNYPLIAQKQTSSKTED